MMTNSKNTWIIVALLILAVAVSACTNAGVTGNTATNQNAAANAGNPANSNQASNAQSNQNSGTSQNTGVKLSDSQYAQFAYLISGDTMDPTAQQAMSGFTMTKTKNNDGTTTIMLSSTNPEYHNQSYTLQPGQQLYFLEANLGDDANNNEGALGDDAAIVVDAQGYIVQ